MYHILQLLDLLLKACSSSKRYRFLVHRSQVVVLIKTGGIFAMSSAFRSNVAPSLVSSDILIQLLVAILNFQKSLLAVKRAY